MAGFLGGLLAGLLCGAVVAYVASRRNARVAEVLPGAAIAPDADTAGELTNARATIAQCESKMRELESTLSQTIAQYESRISELDAELAQTTALSQSNLADTEATALRAVTQCHSRIGELEAELSRTIADSQSRVAELEDELSETISQSERRIGEVEAAMSRSDAEWQSMVSVLERTIAQLESEKKSWQALERFNPRIVLGGAPPHNQFITVSNPEEFRVVELDYLAVDGTKVGGERLDRVGTVVQVPIDESKVAEVQKLGCDPKDGSFAMAFRIHTEVDGMRKPFLLSVRVAVNSASKLEPLPLGGVVAKS